MQSNESIRQQAAQVLQGKDFQKYDAKPESWDFWKWLKDLLDFQFPFENGIPHSAWYWVGLVFKAILVLIQIFVVGYLLYYFYRKLIAKTHVKETTWAISEGERQLARDSYHAMALEAIARQDYRHAIHYLFMATVSMVIQDAHFHGAAYLTNREIASATDFSRFSGSGKLSAAFTQMVHFDEPRWFGLHPVSEADYQTFLKVYNDFQQNVKAAANA